MIYDYCFINIIIIFFKQFLFYVLIYCKTDIFLQQYERY